jgi:hypothetical protein
VNTAVVDLTIDGTIGQDLLTEYNSSARTRKKEITFWENNKFLDVKDLVTLEL